MQGVRLVFAVTLFGWGCGGGAGLAQRPDGGEGGVTAGALGAVCDLNIGDASLPPTSEAINPSASECSSGLCLLPFREKDAGAAGPLCTSRCQTDDDCANAQGASPGDPSDPRCRTGFVCAVATIVTDFCCERFCICKDFIELPPRFVCRPDPASSCVNNRGANDAGADADGGQGVGAPADSGTPDAGEAGVAPPDSGQAICPMMPGDLISDFATDNGISQVSGRRGAWYLYPDMTGDPSGRFDPPLPPPGVGYPIDTTTGNPFCSGPGSLHTKATGFTRRGAGLAVDFVPRVADMVKGSYDASQYRGVAFWARGAAPIEHVRVKFPDIYTDPQAPAPVCVDAPTFPNNCSPYMVKLGKDAESLRYVDTSIDTLWRRFEILFADAVQDRYSPGYHRDPPNDTVDVHHLLGVAIEVLADFSTEPTSANDFEIWIDDVAFIR